MTARKVGLLAIPLLLAAMILSCVVAVVLINNGQFQPPERSVSIGSISVSLSYTTDSHCAEPWSYCDPTDGRGYYAIWLAVPNGPGPSDYEHYSIRLSKERSSW